MVNIGDGRKTSFWKSSWLFGRAPMDIAPGLYRLAWTRGLWRMSTVEEMADFVTLWDLVQQVSLNDQEDQNTWRWTANASYSSMSAYLA